MFLVWNFYLKLVNRQMHICVLPRKGTAKKGVCYRKLRVSRSKPSRKNSRQKLYTNIIMRQIIRNISKTNQSSFYHTIKITCPPEYLAVVAVFGLDLRKERGGFDVFEIMSRRHIEPGACWLWDSFNTLADVWFHVQRRWRAQLFFDRHHVLLFAVARGLWFYNYCPVGPQWDMAGLDVESTCGRPGCINVKLSKHGNCIWGYGLGSCFNSYSTPECRRSTFVGTVAMHARLDGR